MINHILTAWSQSRHNKVLRPQEADSLPLKEIFTLENALRTNFQQVPDVPEELHELQQILRAWHDYAQGHLFEALELFKTQICFENEWQTWALLGLARTHLKLGWWHHARNWCLYTLECSRRKWDEVMLFHAYELLGEIFLRTDQPLKALEVYSRANAFENKLLDHSLTLTVSSACALGRLGAKSQADNLFQEVFFRNPQSVSAQFAVIKGLLSAHLKDDEVSFSKWYQTIRQFGFDPTKHKDLPYLSRIANEAIKQRQRVAWFSFPEQEPPETPVNKLLLERLGLSKVETEEKTLPPPVEVPTYRLNPVDSAYKEMALPQNALEEIKRISGNKELLKWLAI